MMRVPILGATVYASLLMRPASPVSETCTGRWPRLDHLASMPTLAYILMAAELRRK